MKANVLGGCGFRWLQVQCIPFRVLCDFMRDALQGLFYRLVAEVYERFLGLLRLMIPGLGSRMFRSPKKFHTEMVHHGGSDSKYGRWHMDVVSGRRALQGSGFIDDHVQHP